MAQVAKICGLFLLASLALGRIASAQDAGDAGFFGEPPVDGGSTVPLACNGALCDTTNGSGCSAAGTTVDLAWLVIVMAALVFPIVRRGIARGRPETDRSS